MTTEFSRDRMNYVLMRNLFEDYFLNQITGRVNPNPNDWTFWQEHMTAEELQRSWKLGRRSRAIEHIEHTKPFWIIKNPEAQVVLQDISDIFGKVFFIHIIMDGRMVVASSMERGWFRGDYTPIDDYDPGVGFGWLAEEDKLCWKTWNPETRAACVWRTLTHRGVKYGKHKNNCLDKTYQDS